MSKRRSLLVLLIMGLIKFLTAVQDGVVWLISKRYKGQVIRGLEGEVFKHEILTRTFKMESDLEVAVEIEEEEPWETYGDIPPVPLTWFGEGPPPMDDPNSWGEWQMRYDPDSREDR